MSFLSRMAQRITRSSKRKAESGREGTPLSRKSPKRSEACEGESFSLAPISLGAENCEENSCVPHASTSFPESPSTHSRSVKKQKTTKSRQKNVTQANHEASPDKQWEILSDSPDYRGSSSVTSTRSQQKSYEVRDRVTSGAIVRTSKGSGKSCRKYSNKKQHLEADVESGQTVSCSKDSVEERLDNANNDSNTIAVSASSSDSGQALLGATCAELTFGTDYKTSFYCQSAEDLRDLTYEEHDSNDENSYEGSRKEKSTKKRTRCTGKPQSNRNEQKSVSFSENSARSLSADSGFHDNEDTTKESSLQTKNLTLLDRDGFENIEFNDGVERVYEPKPHLWPRLHDTSRNVFHHLSNVALGRPSFQNRQAVEESHILSRIAEFEVVDGDQPFNCRVTTIDWHPRMQNFIAIGSKHGDLGFYKVGLEDYALLQQVKTFAGIGPGGYISALKFHPRDNEKFYTSSLDGKVCMGNFEKDRQSAETIFLNTHSWERWYCSLDSHPFDNMIVAGMNNGLTTLLNRDGKKIWDKRLHNQKTSHLEFSPRDPYLLCSASLDHTVRMWDVRMVEEKKPLECLFHEKGINSAYFSLTDGARIATTDQFDEIRVYRAPFWKLETCIKHPHRFFQHITPIKAYWHPFTDNILCGRFPDDKNYPDYGIKRTMDMFDANTGKMHFSLKDPLYNGIISLCKFNRTGDKLLCAMGHNFYVWSTHAPTDDDQMSKQQMSMVAKSYEGISERGQGRWPGRNRPPGWRPLAEVKKGKKEKPDVAKKLSEKRKKMDVKVKEKKVTETKEALQKHMKTVVMRAHEDKSEDKGKKKDGSGKGDKDKKGKK